MESTLLDWLAKKFPQSSRQTLRRIAASGRVILNGAPERKVNRQLAPTDSITVLDVATSPPRANASHDARSPHAEPTALQIIHEDDDLLVVNKPAGLLTSTVPRERRPTLLAEVRAHVAASKGRGRVGLIHRLDRDASGLLIFSKTDEAYASLKSQFFHHAVERVYSAIVRGIPDPPRDRIESTLIERADGTVHFTRQAGQGRIAVTEYETVRTGKKWALLRVTLHTGRKHQIRVHLSGKGHPIVGDSVYGGAGKQQSDLMLIATRLTIQHPRTGKPMTFEIEMPESFQRFIDAAEMTHP